MVRIWDFPYEYFNIGSYIGINIRNTVLLCMYVARPHTHCISQATVIFQTADIISICQHAQNLLVLKCYMCLYIIVMEYAGLVNYSL